MRFEVSADYNPYSTPTVPVVKATKESSQLEKTRLEHLSHEAALQAVGSLFVITSMIISSLMVIFTLEFLDEELVNNERTFILSYWVLVPIFLYIGIKLRRLDYSIRNTVIAAGVLMLFAFPVGSVIGPFVLYIVCCKKGSFILSERYTNIRYQTPRLQYETKLFTKVFAVIVSGCVGLFIFYYVSPQFRELLNLSS